MNKFLRILKNGLGGEREGGSSFLPSGERSCYVNRHNFPLSPVRRILFDIILWTNRGDQKLVVVSPGRDFGV